MKVLIVDDSMLMRRKIRDLCAQVTPITIEEATNGIEAVEKSDTFEPDLIFMDITMPEMDGVEATKLIKEKHPHIKIVICSALANQEKVMDSLEQGADELITKPFDDAKILNVVNAYHNYFHNE